MHIIHQQLSQRIPRYHHWHQHPYHAHVHWGGLVAVTIVSLVILGILGWHDPLSSWHHTIRIARAVVGGWVDFVDATEGSGTNVSQEPYGHAATFADLNNDGCLDILEPRKNFQNYLYLQNKTGGTCAGTFVDRATQAGINTPAEPCAPDFDPVTCDRYSTGKGIRSITAADYDNDGDVDLHMAAGGSVVRDYFYRNAFAQNGTLHFDEIAGSIGVANNGNGNSGVWADYNRDGFLDLLLSNWPSGDSHALYRNNGAGGFQNTTASAGLGDEGNHQASIFFDYNNDGWIDIFQSRASYETNYPPALWLNNGNGTFTNVTPGSGIKENTTGANEQLGLVALDYNNDSWMDIFIVNYDAATVDHHDNHNLLYRNNGDGTFTDIAASAGVSWSGRTADTLAADFNNDGWMDIFVGCYEKPSMIFFNNGDGTFTEHSSAIGDLGTDRAAGTAAGDYDNDGFVDLYTTNSWTNNRLYHNQGNGNRWLQLDLRTTEAERSAIGAYVKVTAGGMTRMQVVSAGRGLNSQDSPILTFGLGNSTIADIVEISWPSGVTEVMQHIATNQRLTITEGNAAKTIPRNGIFSHELTAASSYSYTNAPTLTVTFSGTSGEAAGKTLTVKGYWDGGKVFRFHGSLRYNGTWDWSAASSDIGLNGQSGNFTVSGALPTDHAAYHGHVQSIATRPYGFQHTDGTPFFFMGDTQWVLFSKYIDNNEFPIYINKRHEQGFNYIHSQVYPINPADSNQNPNGVEIFINNNPDSLNPRYFDTLDERVRAMNEKGIVAGLVFAWANEGWQQFATQVQVNRFIQYMIDRYASMNVVWVLTGEYEEGNLRGNYPNGWNGLGDHIRTIDPYQNLITIHTVDTSADDYATLSWHTMIYQQTSDLELITADRIFSKPVINAEFLYERATPRPDGFPTITADEVRQRAWEIVSRGGWFVYGNDYVFHSDADMSNANLASPGAISMMTLKKFFTSNGYRDVQWPDFTRFNALSPARFFSGKPGAQYVYYTKTAGTQALDLSDASGTLTARCFNPATGGWHGAEFTLPAGASVPVTTPGEAACLITAGASPLDTIPPTVTSFTLRTRIDTDPATFDWTVTDNLSLNRAELWRAPFVFDACDDTVKDSCAWGAVPGKTQTLSGTSGSGSFTDAPAAGTYFYGLHAVDQAGNLGFEPTPLQLTMAGALPHCGNGQIDSGEQCDGNALNSQTCVSLGFVSGALSCHADCSFNIDQCQLPPGAIQCTQCTNTTPCDTSCEVYGYIRSCGEVWTGWWGNTCGDGGVNQSPARPLLSYVGPDQGGSCGSPGQPCMVGDCSGTCDASGNVCMKTDPQCGNNLCGNGQIDPGEQCDGTNFNNQTCQTQGFQSGTLACNPPGGANACRFNTSGCTNPSPVRQCNDGIDNDGDGKTDFPADPGCTSAQDNSELDQVAGACGHTFPRTAFLTFGGSTPDWLEKFDLILSRSSKLASSPTWLPMRDFNRADEFIADYPDEWFLRRSEPLCSVGEDILRGSCSAKSDCRVCYNTNDGDIGQRCAVTSECPTDYTCTVPGEMMCTDQVSLYGLGGSWWSNLSDLGQRYTGVVGGIPANNERLIDWYPKYLKAFMDSKNGDGISSDGLYYDLHFQYQSFENVDLDHNGLNDMTEPGKGNGWFIQHWKAGVDHFLAQLRALIGPDAPLVINTGSSDMSDHPSLNGLYYENSAGESNWDYTRSVYFDGRDAVQPPPLFVQAIEVDGHDDMRTRPSKNYYRYMRFGLARALMLDEYYDFQDLESTGDHYWTKYYDEFDLDIGCPAGDMQQVKNGVWARFFDGGAAILNIKPSPSTVTVSELAALPGYAGPYYHFRGGQDTAMNDGSQFDFVTLQGHEYTAYGGAALISGDGVVLVDTPQTVVTDIFIDNNGSGTSPGSDKAVLSSEWTETCDGTDHYTIRCVTYEYLGSNVSYSTALTNAAGATATFRPTIGVAGNYEVFEWHGTVPNRCTSVPVTINGQGRPSLNQAIGVGQWNSLGTYSFNQGTGGSVVLTSPGGCTAIADVVKFVYRGGGAAMGETTLARSEGAVLGAMAEKLWDNTFTRHPLTQFNLLFFSITTGLSMLLWLILGGRLPLFPPFMKR